MQAWLQQIPSGLHGESAKQPVGVAVQDCPRLLRQIPVASQVPGHLAVGSSAEMTGTQVRLGEHR